MSKSLAERFYAKVDKNGPVPKHCPELGRCHLWMGCHNPDRVRIDGKIQTAQRTAWFLKKKVWPTTLLVHKCNVHQCVNTLHLAENSRADAIIVRPCRKCGATDRLPPRKGTALGNCRPCHNAREARRFAMLSPQQRVMRKARHRTRLYGLSKEQQDDLFRIQGGRCGACKDPIPQYATTTHLDHDHATDVVRGFTCEDCNVAIGRLHDNATRAYAVGNYLDNPPAQRLLRRA